MVYHLIWLTIIRLTIKENNLEFTTNTSLIIVIYNKCSISTQEYLANNISLHVVASRCKIQLLPINTVQSANLRLVRRGPICNIVSVNKNNVNMWEKFYPLYGFEISNILICLFFYICANHCLVGANICKWFGEKKTLPNFRSSVPYAICE